MRLLFSSRLTEALRLQPREVVTLVGGGGKTSLMYALARELAANRKKVITTTTTKIWVPLYGETSKLLVGPNLETLEKELATDKHVTCVSSVSGEGKAVGVKPSTVELWMRKLNVDYIIVEADGARGKPLKAPAPHEPVIPRNTTLYIPMVGIDVLGKTLSEENVHRVKLVAEISGRKLGETVTLDVVAKVLEVYLRLNPENARPTVFINKVTAGNLKKAEAIAKLLDVEEAVAGSVAEGRFWRIIREKT